MAKKEEVDVKELKKKLLIPRTNGFFQLSEKLPRQSVKRLPLLLSWRRRMVLQLLRKARSMKRATGSIIITAINR